MEAVAKFDYNAAKEGELSFRAGDVLKLLPVHGHNASQSDSESCW
uniref:SH3 domain-containing protein n=1 Tax=Salvator merianae TaxID=96440 RepID=A0A8D0DRK8_SALMN